MKKSELKDKITRLIEQYLFDSPTDAYLQMERENCDGLDSGSCITTSDDDDDDDYYETTTETEEDEEEEQQAVDLRLVLKHFQIRLQNLQKFSASEMPKELDSIFLSLKKLKKSVNMLEYLQQQQQQQSI